MFKLIVIDLYGIKIEDMIEHAIERLMKSLLTGGFHFSNDIGEIEADKSNLFNNFIKPKAHRYLEFTSVIEGEAALQLDSKVINIKSDQTWIILPQTLHSEGIVGNHKSYILLWAIIISRGVNFLLSEYNSLNESHLINNRLFVEFPQASELWDISRNPTLPKNILLQARFISFFLSACIQGISETNNSDKKSAIWATSHQKIVRQIKDYISQHYKEDLRISELSAFAGYTPSHLIVLFKKYTNQSIHQYILKVKLQAAMELLTSGQYSIKEVAFYSGFNDPLYFSRVFRKEFGKSPSKYLEDVNSTKH